MHTSQFRPQPPLLFGAVVFAAVVLLISRGVLPPQDSPAFSMGPTVGARIFLGAGFPNSGVHQFSDGMTLNSVIELTGAIAVHQGMLPVDADGREIADGMTLQIVESGGVARIEQGWMPARQRLALGILLHPDRMNREDWIALPGIGESLADQIERDRQMFGDFGRFGALDRVKGIGPAKLKALAPFFVEIDN